MSSYIFVLLANLWFMVTFFLDGPAFWATWGIGVLWLIASAGAVYCEWRVSE